MDAIDRTLATLRARGCPELLEELGWLRSRVEAGEELAQPLVTVHLRSGRELTGWVREVKRDMRTEALVLHVPGPDPRLVRDDVSFVGLSSIEAVTVHDLPVVDRAPSDAPAPPGRLEMRRRLGELKSKLSTLAGVEIACDAAWDRFEEGEPMRGLSRTAAQLDKILGELAADPLGLEALKAKVRAISFDLAERTAVELDGTTLKVGVGASPRARIGEAELKKAVEAVL